jgi:hypothetical protein
MVEVYPYERKTHKSFSLTYDETLDAMVFSVLEPSELFPLYIKDAAGIYRIIKNKSGKLQMCK